MRGDTKRYVHQWGKGEGKQSDSKGANGIENFRLVGIKTSRPFTHRSDMNIEKGVEKDRQKYVTIENQSPKSSVPESPISKSRKQASTIPDSLSEVQKLQKMTYSVHLIGIGKGDLKVFKRRILFAHNPVNLKVTLIFKYIPLLDCRSL